MKKEIKILGHGHYQAAETQQFVDEEGNLVRATKGSGLVNIGEAYAFFYCGSPKSKIQQELPKIRSLAKTPSELELYFIENPNELTGQEIRNIAQEAREASLNYTIRAYYPNQTNKKTADELADILNQAYQSPLFGNEFRGEILYKDKERKMYVKRE